MTVISTLQALVTALLLVTATSLCVAADPVPLKPISAKGPDMTSLRIARVLPQSPATEAGLAVGDTILSINGKTPRDAADAMEAIKRAPKSSTPALLIGSPDGRHAASVRLRSREARLGAQFTGPLLDHEKGVAGFTCLDAAVSATALRWENFHVIHLIVANFGDGPLEFKRQHVSISSGTKLMSPADPDEVVGVLYAEGEQPGDNRRRADDSAKQNWLEELLKGVAEQSNEDAKRKLAKEVYDNVLEDVTIEQETIHLFSMYVIDEQPTWPLTIQVNLRGRDIAFKFVGPRGMTAIQRSKPQPPDEPSVRQQRSEVLDEWYGRMTPARLMQFHAYSTNSGGEFGASNSETRIDLCADGSFTYYSQRSSTMGTGGAENAGGRWTLREQDGQAMLVLDFENGNQSEYSLELGDRCILMNGAKWLKAQQGEHGPACQ